MNENDKKSLCELLEAHERCRREISDVRNHTPNLGIIGRVKYVQNDQEKYPELMKMGYHDMKEIL